MKIMTNQNIPCIFTRVVGLFLLVLSHPALSEYQFDVQKVSTNVYALVGELDQRSADNLGNNSTHAVVLSEDGVILIDSGGSYLGAKQIHEVIKSISDKPVKLVINTGGQDHRWFGNGYFKEQGAQIITSARALEDQHERAEQQLARLGNLIGEALVGTEPVYADEVFESEKLIQIGGMDLHLYHAGAAHTAGDSFVWLPGQKVMFTGDIVFVERALGTGPARNVKSWIEVFEKMSAFQPVHIVPGHGHTTDLETATRDTYDYLNFLYAEISRILDDGVEMGDAVDLDQSRFNYLEVFEDISRKNAQNLYEQLEFDSF